MARYDRCYFRFHKYHVVYQEFMSNTEASDENVKSPSTYGNDAYQEYRKKEKRKNKTELEKP